MIIPQVERSRDADADVTIVIPQFNQVELTCRAIETLRRHDQTPWPLLIVDNGSSSHSLRKLHDLPFPGIRILSLPRAGLTAAWNASVQHIRSERIIFLNNDSVSSGPWVESLIVPLRNGASPVAAAELRIESHLQPPVKLPAGWCFAVDRRMLLELGGFHDALALYFSDTDLFLRVQQVTAGPPWTIVPDLPLTHLAHQTARKLPARQQLWRVDRNRFLKRWGRD